MNALVAAVVQQERPKLAALHQRRVRHLLATTRRQLQQYFAGRQERQLDWLAFNCMHVYPVFD